MSDPLDDEIDLLARALREETDGTSAHAARTLRAILAAPAPRPATSAWALAAAVLLVALVGAPTAWAWWTGRLAERASQGEPTEPPHEVAPAAAAPTVVGPASPSVAPEPIAAPVVAPPAESAPSIAPSRRAPREVAPAAPEEAAVAPSELEVALDVPAPVDPAERRAYETAHALHFEVGAPAAALDAWDAYLAAYPDGRFAVEARYNRALALVRQGRRADAHAALVPFAEGAHGEYRRREARELIDALDAAE